MGGATSIDITKPGIDKAYGIKKLKKVLKIKISEMIFIGDALMAGGNDHPAYQTGVDCIKVSGPEATKRVIEGIMVCLGFKPAKMSFIPPAPPRRMLRESVAAPVSVRNDEEIKAKQSSVSTCIEGKG